MLHAYGNKLNGEVLRKLGYEMEKNIKTKLLSLRIGTVQAIGNDLIHFFRMALSKIPSICFFEMVVGWEVKEATLKKCQKLMSNVLLFPSFSNLFRNLAFIY